MRAATRCRGSCTRSIRRGTWCTPRGRGGSIPAGAWVANARFLPALTRLPVEDALLIADQVAAVRLRDAVPATEFADGDVDLARLVPADGVRKALQVGWWAEHVWDYVRHLVPMLEHDLPILGASMTTELPAGSIRLGEHPVYVEEGAAIEPAVCFDTTAGPILVRSGAHIQSF